MFNVAHSQFGGHTWTTLNGNSNLKKGWAFWVNNWELINSREHTFPWKLLSSDFICQALLDQVGQKRQCSRGCIRILRMFLICFASLSKHTGGKNNMEKMTWSGGEKNYYSARVTVDSADIKKRGYIKLALRILVRGISLLADVWFHHRISCHTAQNRRSVRKTQIQYLLISDCSFGNENQPLTLNQL